MYPLHSKDLMTRITSSKLVSSLFIDNKYVTSLFLFNIPQKHILDLLFYYFECRIADFIVPFLLNLKHRWYFYFFNGK